MFYLNNAPTTGLKAPLYDRWVERAVGNLLPGANFTNAWTITREALVMDLLDVRF